MSESCLWFETAAENLRCSLEMQNQLCSCIQLHFIKSLQTCSHTERYNTSWGETRQLFVALAKQKVQIVTLHCLCGSPRPGWLPPAVHQDLWERESRRGPTAAYHPPGAGGPGSVQNWPPGAHIGGCGLTLCAGESKLSAWYFHCFKASQPPAVGWCFCSTFGTSPT